jgi:hypothetical protein
MSFQQILIGGVIVVLILLVAIIVADIFDHPL